LQCGTYYWGTPEIYLIYFNVGGRDGRFFPPFQSTTFKPIGKLAIFAFAAKLVSDAGTKAAPLLCYENSRPTLLYVSYRNVFSSIFLSK
jgi:hypothetical protein